MEVCDLPSLMFSQCSFVAEYEMHEIFFFSPQNEAVVT